MELTFGFQIAIASAFGIGAVLGVMALKKRKAETSKEQSGDAGTAEQAGAPE